MIMKHFIPKQFLDDDLPDETCASSDKYSLVTIKGSNLRHDASSMTTSQMSNHILLDVRCYVHKVYRAD